MALRNAVEYEVRVYVDAKGKTRIEHWGVYIESWWARRNSERTRRKITRQAFHKGTAHGGHTPVKTYVVMGDKVELLPEELKPKEEQRK